MEQHIVTNSFGVLRRGQEEGHFRPCGYLPHILSAGAWASGCPRWRLYRASEYSLPPYYLGFADRPRWVLIDLAAYASTGHPPLRRHPTRSW